ncbi:MAG: response regulator transcription factor [Thermoflexales bacterium]
MPPTILVVEDDPSIAEPLEYGLRQEGFEVAPARTGKQALTVLAERSVDMVLLDVMLPDLSGYEVCRRIRASSNVLIIMLTARGQELEKVMGLESGADDYVVKPFSFRELLARIRALLRRRQLDAGAPAADAVLQIGAVALDRNTRRVTRRGEPVNLSPREFALLSYLMEHAGRAVSRQELADAVWGENWVGTPRTVDVHVRWLREKLEDDPSHPSLIETVYGFGYLIRRP